ncbi:hypothetical protein GCM10010149_90240 [Nonomuraea roseoviolacea subsp. roseoviolacea]|uniref:hypothetical protein n=1 Tax=Nonomuraea roseoviolacea TaxID=103837 RepID=UPI0031DE5A00
MKKTITTVAACAAALSLAAAPAHAAPRDPVSALKAELVPGHGVRFTEKVTWSDGTDEEELQDRQGVFQFDRKGVAAFDIKVHWNDEDYGRQRAIGIGRTTYHNGGVMPRVLPEGKTWYKVNRYGLNDSYGQVINPAEPTTLAALIKHGKATNSSITGTITFKELKQVSPWWAGAKADKSFDGTKVSYTLTLTREGLASSLRSSYTATENGRSATIGVDTRYSGWGAKVSVKAPDPAKVTTEFR